MSIPPFPSHDLAKLVLGYLAEEQLMTAYDEFLQASPYLDALRNEYDRIFMTSLKSILAEYRAVKIYVETCKPYVLRKKIFQCSNLLDVVKFLVANVDINRIQLQEATEKASSEKPNITITPKPNACESCHSVSLSHCVCKSKQTEVQMPESVSASYMQANTPQNSVEATPLADLPGNHITTRKKHVKVLDKDSILLNSNVSCVQTSDSSDKQSFSSHISPEDYLARCEYSPVQKSESSCLSLNSTVKPIEPSKSNQNIEEFNNVLKSVVNRNKTLSGSEYQSHQRISNANSFQDFASGVTSAESQSATYNVPDSSTSENSNIRVPGTKDVYQNNTKIPPQCQLMLQVSHVNDNIEIQTCREETKPLKLLKSAKLPKIQPKPIEKKIKIISDVKVGNKYNDKNKDGKKKRLVPNNATSTPLLQMQTIMINGTPVYKHIPKTCSYTEDEIMAMPTLIVVPASGPSQTTTSAHGEPIMTQSSSVVSSESSSPRVLGPLVIDVPANTTISTKPTVTGLPDLGEQKAVDSGLVKTVDVKTSNITTASVPKDNVISTESNTPQVLPPTRKSSSTPRRSSHVRVLDFTTPRRILHETINEQVPSQSSDPPVEIVLSGSPNIVGAEATAETIDIKNEIIVVVNEEGNNNDSGSTKENDGTNKIENQAKKYDWDADLRALVANEKTGTTSHRKPKTRTSKKKKTTEKVTANDDPEVKPTNKKRSRSKKSPREKKTKARRNIKVLDEEPPPNLDNTSGVPVKPTINIISASDCEKLDLHESKDDTTKNKSHEKADEYIDTPEAERLSLQNVIGAKLNISDLLETPYKQALYDIQMETPRFLGPDLADEPMSDIKIMNIPTPRFLNTPKPAQATPSSYSSRPTDYSSGGSYYKPDDQDYMPIPDLMICPVTSSKEDQSEVTVEKSTENDSDEKKSRPVRQCTKNVSYYTNFGSGNRTKDAEEIADANSSCSDVISINSSFEFKNKKDLALTKTPSNKSQPVNKMENKKSSTRRKSKSKDSAVKEKTKTFIKIKPRYTPKKETPSIKHSRKNIQSPLSKGSPSSLRKRTTSKERLVNATPVVLPVQTKSRRKSSTPRKLHCTKTYNSASYNHNSPENVTNIKQNVIRNKSNTNTPDSDTEQLALRWSDDGSQDNKTNDTPITAIAASNEIEDISKIQQFIESSNGNKRIRKNDNSMPDNLISKQARISTDGNLQEDLMKRGFDLETAKIIERDLLDDTSLHADMNKTKVPPISVEIVENKKKSPIEKTNETDTNSSKELLKEQDQSDDDEVEFSVHECNEESVNYFVFEHDETKEISRRPPIKLKDNYIMEICAEDDVPVRLKATPFTFTKLDQDPLTVEEIDYSYKETEQAVKSISGMDRLYTPLKDSIKAQVYEIFDSTLTSIDTPLKTNSPVKKSCKSSVSELVLEKETEAKEKTDAKKRKRVRSGSNEPANVSKRTKQDADLLLKTANIQNIDIETVLTKLHGH